MRQEVVCNCVLDMKHVMNIVMKIGNFFRTDRRAQVSAVYLVIGGRLSRSQRSQMCGDKSWEK